jgi:hypothetical protein
MAIDAPAAHQSESGGFHAAPHSMKKSARKFAVTRMDNPAQYRLPRATCITIMPPETLTQDSSAHRLPFQENKPFINATWRDFVDLGAHHMLCHEWILLNQRLKAFPINIVGKECPARVRLEAAYKKKSPAVETSFDPGIVSLKELGGLRLVVGKSEKYDKHGLSCFLSCDGMRNASPRTRRRQVCSKAAYPRSVLELPAAISFSQSFI